MTEADEIGLWADLSNRFCELNHGPDTKNEDFPAATYIVIPIGFKKGAQTEMMIRDRVIPVCYDCASSLLGDEWTLLYCIECCCNHWIHRDCARMKYRHHILWLQGCHKCTGSVDEFRGLYFNDFPALGGEIPFLSQYFGGRVI